MLIIQIHLAMISKDQLNKLDKEIDELFEKETSDSLTKWLLNKRFGNIIEYIGDGKFTNISMSQNFKRPINVKSQKQAYSHKEGYAGSFPINQAA